MTAISAGCSRTSSSTTATRSRRQGLIGPGYKPEIGVSVDAQTTIQDPDGRIYYVAATITPVGELWTSPRTGQSYALQFQVDIPSFGAELTVTTRLQDQEFVVPGAPIYEGTAGVDGTFLGGERRRRRLDGAGVLRRASR